MITQLPRFDDRRAAGRSLGASLGADRRGDVVVLAIPRGGVPVAREVARAFSAPLEVLVTRRLYSPRDGAAVLGAVAETGAVWLNELESMHAGVPQSELSES